MFNCMHVYALINNLFLATVSNMHYNNNNWSVKISGFFLATLTRKHPNNFNQKLAIATDKIKK